MNKNLYKRAQQYKLQKHVDKILADESITLCYSKKRGMYELPGGSGYTEYIYQAGVFPKVEACKWALDSHGEIDILPVNIDLHNLYIMEKIKELNNNIIHTPEAKQCDHINCQYGRCSITGEPICGCCGAYVNTVMTEDEKKEDMQQLFDASEINVHKVTERGYLCYNSTLSCDRPRSCQFYKCCAYSPSNEQK